MSITLEEKNKEIKNLKNTVNIYKNKALYPKRIDNNYYINQQNSHLYYKLPYYFDCINLWDNNFKNKVLDLSYLNELTKNYDNIEKLNKKNDIIKKKKLRVGNLKTFSKYNNLNYNFGKENIKKFFNLKKIKDTKIKKIKRKNHSKHIDSLIQINKNKSNIIKKNKSNIIKNNNNSINIKLDQNRKINKSKNKFYKIFYAEHNHINKLCHLKLKRSKNFFNEESFKISKLNLLKGEILANKIIHKHKININ